MATTDNAIKIIEYKGMLFKDDTSLFNEVKEITVDELSKRLPKDKAFRVVVRVHNGKSSSRRTVTVSDRSRTLRKTLDEIKANGLELTASAYKDGTLQAVRKITFDNLLTEYLESKKHQNSPKYLKEIKYFIDSRVSPSIGSIEIKKITAAHLQKIINTILEEGKAPRTADTVIDYCRPMFEYAIEHDYVSKNPAKKLNVPKYDNKQYFEIEPEKARKLILAIITHPNSEYRLMFSFLITGRRLNEVLSLRWEWIHLESGYYEIPSEVNKARRNENYPLIPILINALELKGAQKEGLVFVPTRGAAKRSNPRHEWAELLKTAGIEKMRIHDTRHLIGYAAANAGFSLHAIGKALGHSEQVTTARYSNINLQTKSDVVETVLNQFLSLKAPIVDAEVEEIDEN
jgi:integrase